jgi:ABC-type uncharacterized transport system substrate-binding protein
MAHRTASTEISPGSPFRQGLRELGYVNVRIEYRWGASDPDRTRKIVAELLALSPDIVFFGGNRHVHGVQLQLERPLAGCLSAAHFRSAGGLISYGPDTIDPNRRAAGYVDRILKGEKPANLPVQAPTKYELIVNLKTAKALGLTVSQALIARADEVIE